MELGIKTEIEVTELISAIPVHGINSARIPDIFFDDIIEAAQETAEKKLQLCTF